MPAHCWGCAVNVTPVGVTVASLPLDPLGACWDCGVFGCTGHAERDQVSGKWLCFPSVAQALAHGARLNVADDEVDDGPTPRLTVRSAAEFVARFSRLAAATRDDRERFLYGDGRAALDRQLDRHAPEADRELAAHAVGVTAYLLPAAASSPWSAPESAMLFAEPPAPPVVVGGLAELLARELTGVTEAEAGA